MLLCYAATLSKKKKATATGATVFLNPMINTDLFYSHETKEEEEAEGKNTKRRMMMISVTYIFSNSELAVLFVVVGEDNIRLWYLLVTSSVIFNHHLEVPNQ